MPKSPYEILGVTETATKDEIKNAYRTLAKTHHPDKGGTVSGFTKIQKAYELLSDQKRRNTYDVLRGVVKNSQQTHGKNAGYGLGANPFMSHQQYQTFANSYFQRAMAGNSAPTPQPNRNNFFIPRKAILAARVTTMPTYNYGGVPVSSPYSGVDEIEIEIDCNMLKNAFPMPNDLARIEFANFSGMSTATVDTVVIEVNYSIDGRGIMEGRLRVRRAGSWQTQP